MEIAVKVRNQQSDIKKEIINQIFKKNINPTKITEIDTEKYIKIIKEDYLPFISKIVSNNSLEFYLYNRPDVFIRSNEKIDEELTFSKGQKKTIYYCSYFEKGLIHELGHAVDFWFSIEKALTKTIIVLNNKTFSEIFVEEFNQNYEKILEHILNEYKKIIEKNLNKKCFEILSLNFYKYQKLKSLKCNKRNKNVLFQRKLIHKDLYKSGFVEAYYEVVTKKLYKVMNDRFSPLLDALSSKYDFKESFLDHHELDYYKEDKYNSTYEMFANLFVSKTTYSKTDYEFLNKLLPKTNEAFSKLFDILYSKIMKNESFDDCEIRRSE